MQTDEAAEFGPIWVPQIGPLCTLKEKNIAEQYPRWSQNCHGAGREIKVWPIRLELEICSKESL